MPLGVLPHLAVGEHVADGQDGQGEHHHHHEVGDDERLEVVWALAQAGDGHDGPGDVLRPVLSRVVVVHLLLHRGVADRHLEELVDVVDRGEDYDGEDELAPALLVVVRHPSAKWVADDPVPLHRHSHNGIDGASKNDVDEGEECWREVWDELAVVELRVDGQGVEEVDGNDEEGVEDAQSDEQVDEAARQVKIAALQHQDAQDVAEESRGAGGGNQHPFKPEDALGLEAESVGGSSGSGSSSIVHSDTVVAQHHFTHGWKALI